MDISQLEVFLAVAREGGFSRAADKLYRTQSAVSQSVRKLEAEIGEPLFDRSSREGLLTDAGRVLQDYAERLINLRENAREARQDERQVLLGRNVLPVAASFDREPVEELGLNVGAHSEGEDPGIALRCYATAHRALVHVHRTELVHGKCPSSDPHTLGTEQDRPGTGEPNPRRR